MNNEHRAFFDADGICRAVCQNSEPLGGFPFFAVVPQGTRPNDVWFNPTTKELVFSEEIEDLPTEKVVPIGQSYEIDIPEDCVALVDGEVATSIDTSVPRRVLVEIKGSQRGQFILNVNSYVESRQAAYPDVGEQLGALYDALKDIIPESEFITVQEAIKAAFPKP